MWLFYVEWCFFFFWINEPDYKVVHSSKDEEMVINILNDLHIGILANFYPEKVTFLKLLKAINLKGDLRLSQVLLYRLKSINSNSSSLNANDIVFVSQPRQARLFISLNEKRKAFFVQYWDVGFPTWGLFSYMAHF